MIDQPQANISLPENLISAIINGQENALTSTLQFVFNEVMKIERELHLKARSYERSSERQGQANGFKNKTFLTSSGHYSLVFLKCVTRHFTQILLRRAADQSNR